MEVKRPTTVEEQINILESRGCIIGDRDFARSVLNKINYYRLTAYFLPFRNPDNTYNSDLTFEKVYSIYEFDRKLRGILFPIIEEIETMLRFQLAYHHAHEYGALGYLDSRNFKDKHNHVQFMNHITHAIKSNEKQLFVKHHLENYDGKFPIWVIIELFSMGELSIFYSDMLVADKKVLAKEMYNVTDSHLSSWLISLTFLRNYCAHYSRLYFNTFPAIPKTPKDYEYRFFKKVFDYILLLKLLYRDIGNWTTSLFIPLQALIDEYSTSIEFAHINFPDNWLELLK